MVCRNSQSVCQIKQFFFIILSFVFYSLFSQDLLANNYLSLLQEGSALRYEHWNLDRKEVTGYSNFLQIYQNEKKQWLEQNANTNLMGKSLLANSLFSQTLVRFNNTLKKIWEMYIRFQQLIRDQLQRLFSIEPAKFGFLNNNLSRARYL